MYIVGSCRLDEILREKKMTQVELAMKVGMKKQQIGAYKAKLKYRIKLQKLISHH